jgi:hypothetical protein
MELNQLITYSFPANVGPADRAFRIGSGIALAAVGFALSLPDGLSATLAMAGIAWAGTGVVSKCGVYYVMGYSTRPASGGGQ